ARVGVPCRCAMLGAGRPIHARDELDAARVDLEGQPDRRIQPDESPRQVAERFRRFSPEPPKDERCGTVCAPPLGRPGAPRLSQRPPSERLDAARLAVWLWLTATAC